MRHRVAGRLFGRTSNHRKALLRGLVTSLFEHERIETTVAKAKEARRLAEKVITLGIRGDLHAKRLALAAVPNRAAVAKLFSDIAPRFKDRNGGYLRIVRTRRRVNDRAHMAVLEFVDFEERHAASEKKKSSKKAESKKETKKPAAGKEAKKAAEKKEDPKKAEKKAAPKKTEKKEAPKRAEKKAAMKETPKKEAPKKKAAAKTVDRKKAK